MGKLIQGSNFMESNGLIPVLDKVIQFSLFSFAAFSMFSISITQISFAIGSLAWLLKVHLTQSWKELKGTVVGIAILTFVLACILSITTSVDIGSSGKFLKKLIQFTIFFWAANVITNEKLRDLLYKLLIIAGAISAINSFTPMFTTDSLTYGRLYGSRLTGTMAAPSTFSGTIMIVGLITLGKFLFSKNKHFWIVSCLSVIVLCLLFTFTRQAWLGFFVGTVFLFYFWEKKYLLIIPLLLAGLLLFAPDTIKQRIQSFKNIQKDFSLQQRVLSWEGGWEIFKDHPVTGCSFKCVDSIHTQYPDPSGWVAYYRGLHSNIFQLLVDTGAIGFGAWLSIWVTYFIQILKYYRGLKKVNSQDTTMGILMGSSAAVLGFLVGGFFETNIYDSEVTMLLYFLMGLSLTNLKRSTIDT